MNRTNWLMISVAALPLVSAYAGDTTTVAAPAAASTTTTAPAATTVNFSPSVAEVVKLAQSGVGDDVVVAYIQNAQAPYNLSANDIVALKNTGFSSLVMAAMLNHDQSLRNQPHTPSYEQRAYAAGPAPSPAPSVAPASATVASAIPNAPTVSTAPQFSGATTAAPAVAPTSAPSAPPTPAQPPPSPQTVVEQAPPAAQVEVVPVAPGPDYYWVPGYWYWRGGWVWVGGRWASRPWHGAVWVGGHWNRHGHGYVWVGGGWR